MTPQEPIRVSITAHRTPHASDPPDAHVFYAALGMLSVAWGRLEGHVNGNLLTIMKFPEVAPPHNLSIKWEGRMKLWKRAFSEVGVLQLHTERAVALMNCIVEFGKGQELRSSRHLGRIRRGRSRADHVRQDSPTAEGNAQRY